ncbi:uncharacterized protein LOC105662325 [Megachile rotundata]|uniref:uncharacterized protein LOC105662325 n=1 Tax=Megachile rotundata TaxID=143995 RepID=UPI003FD2D64B
MSIKLLSVFLLLFVVQNIYNAVSYGEKDENWLNSVYYNWKTGLKDKLNAAESTICPHNAPCYCKNLTCNCCATLDIPKIVNGKTCVAVTYLPQDLGIKILLTLDGKELFSQTISVRNPPPICIVIPYVPVGKVCVRVYDIEVVGYKVHMCVDLVAPRVNYVLHFDCFEIGFGGIPELLSGYASNVKTTQAKPQISQPEIKIQP